MIKILTLIALLLSPHSNAQAPHIVRVAESFIGQGETCGDNCGEFVYRVLNENHKHLPWCAGFVSFALQESGEYGNLPYITKAREFLKYGKRVSKPMPGDVVVWSRGNNANSGHVGIVRAVYKGYFEAIEGNTGVFPSKVRVVRHKWREASLIGFRRLK